MKNSSINTGKKIRYFRERVNESQLNIELAMNASPGTLSRIENGQTNPTKETLLKISKYLKLNNLEVNYLFGQTENPSTQKEFEDVTVHLQEYLNKKNTLAYVVDDRYRFVCGSKGFMKLMGLSQHQVDSMIGASLVNIVMQDSFGINQFLDEDEYESILENLIYRYYVEVGFMVCDTLNLDTIALIKNNIETNKFWIKAQDDYLKNRSIFTLESRRVAFKFGLFKISLYFTIEPLTWNERFQMVEYTPTNLIFRILQKI